VRELLLMAWRNVWRSRRRTLITLAAGSLGLMFSQAYLNWANGIYAQMIDEGVRSASGHVSLYRQGYRASREAALSFPLDGLPERLAAIPGVETALPRLYLPGLAQAARGSRGVTLVGVDPGREWRVNPFARGLAGGKLIDGTSDRECLVGKELVESLKLKLGGKLVVMAQRKDGEIQGELLRVAGILDTGMSEIDGRTIYTTLGFAGRLAGREGEAHELAVILGNQRSIPAVLPRAAALLPPGGGLEAVDWQTAMPEMAGHIRVDTFSLKLIVGFIFLIVGIGMVNTQLMSVLERSREFGVMLALGVPTLFLVGMVLAEGLLMGLTAAAAGTLLGSGVTAWLVERGVDVTAIFGTDRLEVTGTVFSGVMKGVWSPASMAWTAVVVMLLYPLASIYPAWKVTRLRPVETMRHT
jgi:ABC-type lipoprotein release transport system permease subunit